MNIKAIGLLLAIVGATPLSTLPVLAQKNLFKLPTRSIREREPNFRASEPIPISNQLISIVRGDIGSCRFPQDVRDTFFISQDLTGDSIAVRILFRKKPLNKRFSILLVEDSVRNGRIDRGDRVVFRIGAQQQSIRSKIVRLTKEKRYLFAVSSSRRREVCGDRGLPYEVAFEPVAKLNLQVNIIRAKAFGRFDPKIPFSASHKADFFAEVWQGKRQLGRTQRKSNNNQPTFNKVIKARFPGRPQAIPLTIRLIDRDSTSRNDKADISTAKTRDLNVTYFPSSGLVKDHSGKTLGKRGQTITVRGRARKHKGEITFKIDHS